MHYCEAGYCKHVATVDFKRYIRCTGIPGKVRYLCDKDSQGLKVRPEHRIKQKSAVN